MATSPATAPEMAPRAVGCRCESIRRWTSRMAAGGGGKWVLTKALGARELAAERRLPALKPNQPTHKRQAPIEAEHHGVGLHFGVGVADALAQIKTADQRRDAAGDVDHGATGEIQRGDAAAGRVQQPSHAPDHVGHRTINDERPERQKDRHGAELHAFGKGAGDQRRVMMGTSMGRP